MMKIEIKHGSLLILMTGRTVWSIFSSAAALRLALFLVTIGLSTITLALNGSSNLDKSSKVGRV